jgi:TldD protein
MPSRVTLEAVDAFRDEVASIIHDYAARLRGLRYADIRVEVSEGKAAAVENGDEKFSGEDYGFLYGVRAISGKEISAAGFHSGMLGAADLPNLATILRIAVKHAHDRAMASAAAKWRARERFAKLGGALDGVDLAPIEVHTATVPARYESDPRRIPLAEVVRTAREASKAIASLGSDLAFNYVGTSTGIERQLFVSTEGANIDEARAITEAFVYVVAQHEGASVEIYDTIGHQRGWEVCATGYDDGYIKNPPLETFAAEFGAEAAALAGARPLPATDKEVVVVTDPHFNALVAHEVVGHPTELDRALKMETAYAGRSWLLTDARTTQVGNRFGCELVNATADPSLPGYGHYQFDDEGTPGRHVRLVEDGIFRGFMNSRETAAIIGAEPNGSFKAADASMVPLIRMSNVYFEPGTRDPAGIIAEVDHGYYVSGHRIPSIAESRENFRITAIRVQEIRNGQLGEIFRDGGITSDTRDYFLSIDAVGSDLRLFPIPNCGKGQPMQAKRLGNGGPTMRGRAKLTGAGG